MAHPELAAEQAYLDHAYECLDRMRSSVERAAESSDNEVAAVALEAWARRRLRTFQDAGAVFQKPWLLKYRARTGSGPSLESDSCAECDSPRRR